MNSAPHVAWHKRGTSVPKEETSEFRELIPLTATGMPEQVKAHCRDLIDCCGTGGGYIVTAATQIDDRGEEAIRAMVDFTKAYRVHRGQ